MKKLLIITLSLAIMSYSLAESAPESPQENKFTLTAEKYWAAIKTIACATASASFFTVSARLNSSKPLANFRPVKNILTGAHNGAALVMFSIGVLCAFPAVTNGIKWLELTYHLHQLEEQNRPSK